MGENLILGGLFEEANSMEEIAFKYAVDHINRNRELLPESRVMAQIERIPTHDSFYASKRGNIWFKFPTYHSQRDDKSGQLLIYI